ncbi:hypothetical protein EMPG_13979 [Blastomyces silverae]|uniref:Uncharacterized protein n=1 Tax=Blastomyces silverae TaxID=2060906 RepID=A0A0H1BGK0_9EURO|nr:hypothetical protein EMPG_13979 [Blastomyces silverae]
MALSIKHKLQRWTVQQLHRIGFTNVTLSTPLPTRGDGSTFDMDEDYDTRSAQLRGQHGHPRTHSHADINEGSRAGPGILEGWVVLVRIRVGEDEQAGRREQELIEQVAVRGPVMEVAISRAYLRWKSYRREGRQEQQQQQEQQQSVEESVISKARSALEVDIPGLVDVAGVFSIV